MAVIREKRQFKIGTIGVARAPQFGGQGQQMVARQITSAADQFADMFYREAAENAEKAGIEAGRSADRNAVITINPKTGEPEAYEPPSGFGRIAAEAYERVVLRRFEQSIEEEIKNKGKELAVKYEDNANGVALYETAMGEYIASMSNAAEGQFKSYIADVGTSYLNATRTSMAINQVRRERAAAKKAQIAAFNEANNSIEFLIANQGPQALTGETETQAIIQSANQTIGDGAQAGLIDPAEFGNMSKDTRLAMTRGLIRYASGQASDPDTLKMLQHAVGTQNPNAVPDEFAYVADAMRAFGNDYSSLGKLEQFSDGLLSDAVQYATVIEEQEVARQEAEMAVTIFDLENNLSAVGAAERASATMPTNEPSAVAKRAAINFEDYTQRARTALANGDAELSKVYIDKRDAAINAQAEGLYLRAVSNITTDESDEVQRAIIERKPSLAPESSQSAIRAVLRLESDTGIELSDPFLSFVRSYGTGAGRAVEAERENTAAIAAGQIDIRSIAFSDDPVGSVAAAVQEISGIKDLNESLRNTLINQATFNGGKSALNAFFSGAPTQRQIDEARSLIEGGTVAEGVLTEKQQESLLIAREYANESGKISEMRTVFNNQNDVARRRREFANEQQEKARTLQKIKLGMGVPTNRDQRKLVEEDMESRFSAVLQGRTLASIWSDPRALQDERLLPIFDQLSSVSVMPESLHNALTTLANDPGQLMQPNTILSHYINFRDYNFEGVTMSNSMMKALTDSEQVMLDFMADTVTVFGNQSPERLAEIFRAKQEFDSKPQVKERAKEFFGDTLTNYVMSLDGMEDAPPSSINAMSGAALTLLGTGVSAREITKRLERQIERTFPNGRGYVFGPGKSTRTQYPISVAAPGNEDLFRKHVIDRITLSNPGMTPSFGTSKAWNEFARTTLPMPERDSDYIYLMPLDASSDGEVRYIVKQSRSAEEGGDITIRGSITDEGGLNRVAPLIVSNRDPQFVSMVFNRQNAEEKDEMEAAKRRLNVYEAVRENPDLILPAATIPSR